LEYFNLPIAQPIFYFMKKLPFIIPIVAIGILFSCNKEAAVAPPTTECAGLTPTYETDIKAIVSKNCAYSGCHSATNRADGIDLSTYALTKAEIAKARFMASINHEKGYSAMPERADKLPATSIQTLNCWIKNGTPQ
jgi:hypothetical protein